MAISHVDWDESVDVTDVGFSLTRQLQFSGVQQSNDPHYRSVEITGKFQETLAPPIRCMRSLGYVSIIFQPCVAQQPIHERALHLSGTL